MVLSVLYTHVNCGFPEMAKFRTKGSPYVLTPMHPECTRSKLHAENEANATGESDLRTRAFGMNGNTAL